MADWAEATDEDVLRGVAARDEQALGALYDRYGARMFGLAYRILGERGAAEDAVQDAFMSVWRRATSYESGRGSVVRWLLAIVHHRALDDLRGKRGRARQDPSLDLFARVLATSDPWQEVDLLLRREQVRQWLADLPDDQRQVLELAYFQGHTQSEIAAMLELPLGTLKSRVRSALQHLRALAHAAQARAPHAEPPSRDWATGPAGERAP